MCVRIQSNIIKCGDANMKVFELNTEVFECFIRKNNSIPNMTMPHIHEVYELSLVLSGESRYLFKDFTAKIKCGSMILIKPFEVHKTLPVECDYERILFHFNSSIFSAVFSDKVTNEILSVFSNRLIDLGEEETEKATKMLLEIKNCLDSEKKELATIYLAKFLAYIRRFCKNKGENHTQSMISDIMKYINSNIAKVSIEDICNNFYMSSQNLNMLFKKELFMTPHKYIDLLRMNYALELIKEDNLSVDEVAYFCGYGSCSYFCSKFKKTYGQTPMSYKKAYSTYKYFGE